MNEFEQLGKSKFQIVCVEDCVQYSRLFKQYTVLQEDITNIDLANSIANKALVLAARWSEIGTFTKEVYEQYGFGKTEFRMWAHEHYSLMKEIHVHCRSIWRDAKEELRDTLKYGG